MQPPEPSCTSLSSNSQYWLLEPSIGRKASSPGYSASSQGILSPGMPFALLSHAHDHWLLPFSYSSTFLRVASTAEMQLSLPVQKLTLSGTQRLHSQVDNPPSISAVLCSSLLSTEPRDSAVFPSFNPICFRYPYSFVIIVFADLSFVSPLFHKGKTMPEFSNRSVGYARQLRHSVGIREVKEHF